MHYNSYYFCPRSCKSHSQENEKFMSTTGQFSRTEDRSFICTLDLIDLVMHANPSVPKGMNMHLSLTFHIKQGKMIHFSSLVKCDVPNRIQSLSFFKHFWLRSCKFHPLESSRIQGVNYHAHIAYRLKKKLRLYCDRSCDENQIFQRGQHMSLTFPI